MSEHPTWYQEAVDEGINYIVLVYEKAEGFVFCPSNLEKPFRVGGDYDGNWEVNAAVAIDHFNRYLNQAYTERIQWFMHFVHKVDRGEDFSLSDLEIEKRQLRIIHGKWPW